MEILVYHVGCQYQVHKYNKIVEEITPMNNTYISFFNNIGIDQNWTQSHDKGFMLYLEIQVNLSELSQIIEIFFF